jgi:hypothetical protein
MSSLSCFVEYFPGKVPRLIGVFMCFVRSLAFERGQIDFQGFSETAEIMTYESNIAYTMRFMVDTKVSLWLI